MEPKPAVEPARPEEQAEALRLLFCDLPSDEREQRVARVLGLLRTGELSAAGILIERGTSGPTGVLVCLPVPGASALFWPPRSVTDSEAVAREDRLLAEGLRRVRQGGAKLAQAMLAPDEMPLAPALERNGFSHVTRLWYLAHDLNGTPIHRDTPGRLTYRAYELEQPSLFHTTLLRTYIGTMDCPEVSGVRSVEEVITGHKSQGHFDPNRWWLVFEKAQAVGVCLMTGAPDNSRDVSYIGVVPEARRRGFASEILYKAFSEAKEAGISRITLSVDARNDPALRLYRTLGFAPYDRREVFLMIWR